MIFSILSQVPIEMTAEEFLKARICKDKESVKSDNSRSVEMTKF